MKKLFFLCVAIGAIAFSCRKTATTHQSKFSITFNNKTISDSSIVTGIISAAVYVPNTCSHCSSMEITVKSHDLICHLSGSNPVAVGLASGFIENSPAFYIDSLTDIGDSNRVYTVNGGTINLALYNSGETSGTFNVTLLNGGISYPATGSYDYRH